MLLAATKIDNAHKGVAADAIAVAIKSLANEIDDSRGADGQLNHAADARLPCQRQRDGVSPAVVGGRRDARSRKGEIPYRHPLTRHDALVELQEDVPAPNQNAEDSGRRAKKTGRKRDWSRWRRTGDDVGGRRAGRWRGDNRRPTG